MIYMLWKECMPQKFYQYICKEKNSLQLDGKNIFQPKVLKIITDFLGESKENYKDLRNNLSSYKNIFQYVYSNVFPEIYCSTELCGFDLKHNFHIILKTYKDKKNQRPLLQRILITTRKLGMKHMFMNRNLLRLMILMKLKRKKLRSGLKTKKKKKRGC